VLILGPTGSGKEVVARMIHELSRRGTEKFQAVNCAALPDTLFESEIFGFEKGAFTGAHDRKPGRLELADHGTLFLDEIGDLSLVAQAKLLRVLEDRRFERLGGQKSLQGGLPTDIGDQPPARISSSAMRASVRTFITGSTPFSIRLPSLRERPVDIPVLANRFLGRYCAGNGLPLDGKTLSAEAISRLQAYPWPGNIRELESTVSRAALSAPGRVIRDSDVEFLHAGVAMPVTDGRRAFPPCATPSVPISSACWTPSRGTRRKRRGCWRSAAARSTGKSASTPSSQRSVRPGPKQPNKLLLHAGTRLFEVRPR
jgi:Nif-specific regulatory protein